MDEITPEPLYRRRREFIRNSLLFTATSVGVGGALLQLVKGRVGDHRESAPPEAGRLSFQPGSPFDTTEARTPYRDVTSYNNFYEFGVDKDEPATRARAFRTRPWSLAVFGEVARP